MFSFFQKKNIASSQSAWGVWLPPQAAARGERLPVSSRLVHFCHRSKNRSKKSAERLGDPYKKTPAEFYRPPIKKNRAGNRKKGKPPNKDRFLEPLYLLKSRPWLLNPGFRAALSPYGDTKKKVKSIQLLAVFFESRFFNFEKTARRAETRVQKTR